MEEVPLLDRPPEEIEKTARNGDVSGVLRTHKRRVGFLRMGPVSDMGH